MGGWGHQVGAQPHAHMHACGCMSEAASGAARQRPQLCAISAWASPPAVITCMPRQMCNLLTHGPQGAHVAQHACSVGDDGGRAAAQESVRQLSAHCVALALSGCCCPPWQHAQCSTHLPPCQARPPRSPGTGSAPATCAQSSRWSSCRREAGRQGGAWRLGIATLAALRPCACAH